MSERQTVPDVLLLRYLAGDLSAEERRRIEAQRDASQAVRRRLDELATERSAFLAADPPAAFAHRVATRLVHDAEAGEGWRSLWAWAAPSAAVALGLVGVVIYVRFGERPAETWRSTAPVAESSRRRGAGRSRVVTGR